MALTTRRRSRVRARELPFRPQRRARLRRRQQARELAHAPRVAEVAREPEADAHDAELAAHVRLERAQRRVRGERGHRAPEPEQRGGAARVAHAPRAQRDAVPRRGVLDERVREHLPRGLGEAKGEAKGGGGGEERGSVGTRAGSWEAGNAELTSRKRSAMTDPASACSPTALTVLLGRRESTRTTGAPVVSCRSSSSELMR